MLLWLNGPFGGGKTQTAHELQRRLPGSIVCDPEPGSSASTTVT
jgi:tRNA A37 N6-isopentenylltransferase MiaA